MITTKIAFKAISERKALSRRLKQMYEWLNHGQMDQCFTLIDPELAEQGRVHLPTYVGGMRPFKEAYGSIRVFHRHISLHLDASTNKHDPRPFAYVYVTWQDETHGFHLFKERWVKHDGKWYTRVVGLVPNKKP